MHREQSNSFAAKPKGCTAQYGTLARALGLALIALEDTIDQYRKTPGWIEGPGSIQIEAQCVTVTLLSAALCESAANTILAMLLPPDKFNPIEKRRTTLEKWTECIPEAARCNEMIPDDMRRTIEVLFDTRNAIVHAKAKVFCDEETFHLGTAEKWDILNSESARKFATLTINLVDRLPPKVDAAAVHISHFIRDYWLMKALARKGENSP